MADFTTRTRRRARTAGRSWCVRAPANRPPDHGRSSHRRCRGRAAQSNTKRRRTERSPSSAWPWPR